MNMWKWFSLALGATVVVLPAEVSAQTGVDEPVLRGAAIDADAPLVVLEDVLGNPDAYSDQVVTVEGTVKQVCQMMGCWMELVSSSGTTSVGIRVTFKDYGFFVPKDSQGRFATLQGEIETSVFSKEDADHLIAEGVSLTRNPDGTATELSFVAAGVELRSNL
jgi:hypothetical protein